MTFEQVTPISIEVIYCPRPMHMWSIKQIGQFVNELLIGNTVHTYCDSDLDLWPSDPNFNRSHLLSKANPHVKYQANRSIRWRVIDRKWFSHLLWQWPWPFYLVTTILIGYIYFQGRSKWEVSSKFVNWLTSYWSETIFTIILTLILTLGLVTQIARGVIYWPRPMHIRSI
jgi:hypothetical protein